MRHFFRLGSPRGVAPVVVALLAALALAVSPGALADGTETLGPPSVPVADATNVLVAGVGMQEFPNLDRSFSFTVPTGATVKQVLLYWQGHWTDHAPHPANTPQVDGDNEISVNGTLVMGTKIGGSTAFFGQFSGPVEGTEMFVAYRADITALNLVSPGANTLTIGDMLFRSNFPTGFPFDQGNDGAGVLVLYDDNPNSTVVGVRDGLDLAFRDFAPPLDATVPQTFTFAPAATDRAGTLATMAGNVAGPDLGGVRGNVLRVTFDVGPPITFVNPWHSDEGAEFDTPNLPITVPAGASSMTVQAFSEGGDRPSSFAWIAASASIESLPPDVDARITITPQEDVNPVGSPHVFTAHVTVDRGDGAGFVDAPDGTQITFTKVSGPGSFTTVNPCTTSGGTGTCTITLVSSEPGTTVVSASTTLTVEGVELTRTTDGQAGNSGPAQKDWVAARILIAPDAVNEVGDPHTFTVTVERDTGSGYTGVQGVHVDVTLIPSGGATLPGAPTGSCTAAGPNTDADGRCTITFVSPTAGRVTGTASAAVPIDGETVVVETDGTGDSSGPAEKAFVDANVSITPSAVNEVGDAHTFTITSTAFPAGTTATLTSITPSVSPAPGSMSSTCGSPAVTGDTATCTVTINSSSAGTFTANATAEWSFAGSGTPSSATVTRSTSANSGPGGSGPATKRYVDANVSIVESAVNEVGDEHTFTISTTAFPAGTTPSLVSLTPSVSPAPDSLSSNCDSPVVSGSTATCTLTIGSGTPGTFTANATAVWSFSGLAGNVARSTAGDSGPGGSGPATKRFVDARIAITPQSAVNPVGSPHVFTAGVTINRGDGAGYVNAPDGTQISFTKLSGPGDFTTANPCTIAGGTGTCTITLVSSTPGTTVVGASTTVTVDGVQLTRTTNGQAGSSGPAEKVWAAVRILIAPDDVNPVGEPHTFTATVERDSGAGFAPVAGQSVTITLTGSNGAAPNPAGPVVCTTSAAGQCSATFTSATAGLVTGSASATVAIPGDGSVTVTTNGVAPSSAPAVKRFVDARIGLTPLTAVNPVNTDHVFTATVTVNAGAGFVPAPNGTQVAFTLVSGPGSFTTPTTCATVAGTCTVTLRSAVAGTSVVSATTTVTVQGVALTRTTNGQAGNSGTAEKQWTVFTPPAVCRSLTATPRSLQAGRRTTIVARARLSNGRPMARAQVRVTAPGVNVTRRTNAQGVARITVRPTRAGIVRIQVVGSAQCQARRGIIGVFRPPPLTG